MSRMGENNLAHVVRSSYPSEDVYCPLDLLFLYACAGGLTE